MPIFKELKQVMQFFDPVTKEPIEEDNKGYLLILGEIGSESFDKFEAVPLRGRRATFEYLQSSLGAYDMLNSFVLAGKMHLGQEVSIYTFLRLCIERKYFPEETLSVEDLSNYVFMDGNESDTDLDLVYTKELNSKV